MLYRLTISVLFGHPMLLPSRTVCDNGSWRANYIEVIVPDTVKVLTMPKKRKSAAIFQRGFVGAMVVSDPRSVFRTARFLRTYIPMC